MKKLGVVVMLVVLLLVSNAQANLLDNGDFEIGTVTPGKGTATFDCQSWERAPAEIANAWLDADPSNSGEKSIRMKSENIWVYQDFQVSEGFTYLFSADTYQLANNQVWIPRIQVEWYDASQIPIGSPASVAEIAPADLDLGDDIDSGVWYEISGWQTAPQGAVSCRMILNLYRTQTVGKKKHCYFDNASCISVGGGNPSPADGSTVDPSLVTELSWDNPVTEGGNDVTWKVWLGVNDPNLTLLDSGTAASGSSSSVTITPPLSLDSTYYWRVDVNDLVNDANGLHMMFDTINGPPVVDAGDSFNAWLSSGSVTAPLNGSAADDGLPSPPVPLVYTWSSDPSAGVSFADASAPATDVTFTAAGTYTLTLEANDSVLTGTGSITVIVSAEGDDRLVALYEFESDPNDNVGGHHGTLVGNPNLPVFDPNDSKVGTGSLHLFENNQSVEVPDSISLDPNTPSWADFQTTGQLTISAWFKPEIWGPWGGLVVKANAYSIQKDNVYDYARLRIGNWKNPVPQAATIDYADGITISLFDGNWHHMAVSYDGDKMLRYYVDGILEAEEEDTNHTFLPKDSISPLVIGSKLNAGRIDQVRMYDVALSSDMIWDQFIADGGSNSCRQLYTPGDLSQDCYTDVDDLELLAAEWITVYDLGNFALMAAEWLECIDQTDPACSAL